MVKDIARRIDRLRELAEKSGRITAYFTDGTCKAMDGGECILLMQDATPNVKRFEVHGSGNGLLSDLLNDMLNERE